MLEVNQLAEDNTSDFGISSPVHISRYFAALLKPNYFRPQD